MVVLYVTALLLQVCLVTSVLVTLLRRDMSLNRCSARARLLQILLFDLVLLLVLVLLLPHPQTSVLLGARFRDPA